MEGGAMKSWLEFERTGSVEAYLKYKEMTADNTNKGAEKSTVKKQSFT